MEDFYFIDLVTSVDFEDNDLLVRGVLNNEGTTIAINFSKCHKEVLEPFTEELLHAISCESSIMISVEDSDDSDFTHLIRMKNHSTGDGAIVYVRDANLSFGQGGR